MHITDWLEMLGEHFPLVVTGCAAEPQTVRG